MSHALAQNGFTLYHLGQDGQCTLKDSERGSKALELSLAKKGDK